MVDRFAGWDAPVYAKELRIGRGCTIKSPIGRQGKPLDRVVIGDHVHIGEGCEIWTPELTIGDYTKLHRNALVYGRNPVSIGHNCWFGEGTIIDGEGQVAIADNVGVGAHSQLWSHIRHGDRMMGCTYHSFGTLSILHDVWFVGHCVVSPIQAEPFSVALVGSVVTRPMERNHVYGGSPAVDLTEKLGAPYTLPSVEDREAYLRDRLIRFRMDHTDLPGGLQVVTRWLDQPKPDTTYFNVVTRQYTKRGSIAEVAFMKALLPEAKFVPV
jgi:acetyltransferase-like isoleucine patch superfamily enzyme